MHGDLIKMDLRAGIRKKSSLLFIKYGLDLVSMICYNRNKKFSPFYFWKMLRNHRLSSPDSPPVTRSSEI